MTLPAMPLFTPLSPTGILLIPARNQRENPATRNAGPKLGGMDAGDHIHNSRRSGSSPEMRKGSFATSASAAGLSVFAVASVLTIKSSAASPNPPLLLGLQHWNLDAGLTGKTNGFGVTRVGVPRDADARIVGEHEL